MLKFFIKLISLFALIVLTFPVLKSNASMLTDSLCSVTAEVIKLTDGTDTGYIYLKIEQVSVENDCPVKVGEVYMGSNNYFATDGYPASFKVGDIIKSDIQSGSSNGPNGATSYLNWSNVTKEDNTKIPYKLGNVDFIQTEMFVVSESEISRLVVSELTFEADCLIGAENQFENWACKNNFFTGLAYRGILTEITIIVAIILTCFAFLLYRKRQKDISPSWF